MGESKETSREMGDKQTKNLKSRRIYGLLQKHCEVDHDFGKNARTTSEKINSAVGWQHAAWLRTKNSDQAGSKPLKLVSHLKRRLPLEKGEGSSQQKKELVKKRRGF